jgi:hypothetical protein
MQVNLVKISFSWQRWDIFPSLKNKNHGKSLGVLEEQVRSTFLRQYMMPPSAIFQEWEIRRPQKNKHAARTMKKAKRVKVKKNNEKEHETKS